MPREIIRTDQAPQTPPSYSQAVRAAGLVFVAGQGPFDPATGDVQLVVHCFRVVAQDCVDLHLASLRF